MTVNDSRVTDYWAEDLLKVSAMVLRAHVEQDSGGLAQGQGRRVVGCKEEGMGGWDSVEETCMIDRLVQNASSDFVARVREVAAQRAAIVYEVRVVLMMIVVEEGVLVMVVRELQVEHVG
jgi:hypothetical protein